MGRPLIIGERADYQVNTAVVITLAVGILLSVDTNILQRIKLGKLVCAY